MFVVEREVRWLIFLLKLMVEWFLVENYNKKVGIKVRWLKNIYNIMNYKKDFLYWNFNKGMSIWKFKKYFNSC